MATFTDESPRPEETEVINNKPRREFLKKAGGVVLALAAGFLGPVIATKSEELGTARNQSATPEPKPTTPPETPTPKPLQTPISQPAPTPTRPTKLKP